MAHKKFLAVAGLTAVLVLAGCSGEAAPEPTDTPAPSVTPELEDSYELFTDAPQTLEVQAVTQTGVPLESVTLNVTLLDGPTEVPVEPLLPTFETMPDDLREASANSTWYEFKLEQSYVTGDPSVAGTTYFSWAVRPGEPNFQTYFFEGDREGCGSPYFDESLAAGEAHTLCVLVRSIDGSAPEGLFFTPTEYIGEVDGAPVERD